MDAVAQGRSNVAPLKMPWDLIRTLVTETYGGKIDDEEDFEQLRQLVTKFLTPEAYDDDHMLVQGMQDGDGDGDTSVGGLMVPGGTGMKGYLKWVEQLPEREPPTYLGLPANAEKLLLVGHGKKMIQNLSKITEVLDEGEQLMGEDE